MRVSESISPALRRALPARRVVGAGGVGVDNICYRTVGASTRGVDDMGGSVEGLLLLM